MYVIGLTGGIGSGKSQVSDRLRDLHGITVVDADEAAREVVEPGAEALAKIVEHFGDGVLDAAGALDRAALRELIFADPEQRTWLESLLHPLIGARMQRAISESASAYQIQSAPLLLERGRPAHLARVLVVDAPPELQLSRTAARDGVDESQVREIMAVQLPRDERLALADDVILNDAGLEELHAAVDTLHEDYLRLAAGRPT
ncbi:MAG: dephospho-CoA kinase [Gammaproteobacteria bacterium AqS3]|nr:dephospho-CoA kinase [Gammaproteobacteria bacterium AqS3]